MQEAWLAMTMGDRIRSARESAGLTQESLAGRLRVSAMTPSRWERNVSRPRVQTIREIAKATGKTSAWFLEDDDEDDDPAVTEEALALEIRDLLTELRGYRASRAERV